jgi:hypothetical protein
MPLTINNIDLYVGHSDSVPPTAYQALAAVCVAPVDSATDPETIRKCLGSGFLIQGYTFHFLTAKHVIAEEIAADEVIVLVLQGPSGNLISLPTVAITQSANTDIAYGSVATEGNLSLPGFQIASSIKASADYVTLEHSGTRAKPEGGLSTSLSIRKGYIVSQGTYDLPGDLLGSKILEMSYQCLKGASGSPVFDHTNCEVAGIMVQNVNHELDPTQISQTVDDQGNIIEEIKYLMPQAVAISAETLNEELNYHMRH